jgi:REP element-mobilizing transposase RayT
VSPWKNSERVAHTFFSIKAPERGDRSSIATTSFASHAIPSYLPRSPHDHADPRFRELAMPQSFACLHYHLIFGTKHRQSLITPELEPRLFDYIGGILRGEGGRLVATGARPDHVHLLVSLSREMSVSEALRIIKANSSGWVHKEFHDMAGFAWQAGYGAFGVSYSHLDAVKNYLARQAEHHRHKSFQEEFVEFLRKHEIEFDERYLWD